MNFQKTRNPLLSRFSSLLLGLLVQGGTSALAVDPLEAAIGAPAAEYFRLSSSTGKLVIESDEGKPRLVYSPKADASGNSTLTAIFAPQRHFLRSTADRISLEFRISQNGSFGVQWRAENIADNGYLALINQWADDRGAAKLFSTRMLPPSGQMQNDMIGTKNIRRFNGKNWHRLDITTHTTPAGVEITVAVTEIEGGDEVVLLKFSDTKHPLEASGLFGLRFFLPPASVGQSSGVIEVRNIAVEPELN